MSESTIQTVSGAPALPSKFYHITRKLDLDSILIEGLTPRIGDRSELIGEDQPRIYLFDSKLSAEDGLCSWLADQFDEDEELVLLTVEGRLVSKPEATYLYEDEDEDSGYGPSTEWTTVDSIPASSLHVEGTI